MKGKGIIQVPAGLGLLLTGKTLSQVPAGLGLLLTRKTLSQVPAGLGLLLTRKTLSQVPDGVRTLGLLLTRKMLLPLSYWTPYPPPPPPVKAVIALHNRGHRVALFSSSYCVSLHLKLIMYADLSQSVLVVDRQGLVSSN